MAINTDLISDLREYTDDIGTYTAIWEMRTEPAEPDAQARRCATQAVKAIDLSIERLHALRSQLIGSIRQADDMMMARTAEVAP